MRRTNLHYYIFGGMALGFVVGAVLNAAAPAEGVANPAWRETTLWWLDLLGPTMFIAALKMIIAPLILASIVSGVTSLPNLAELGAIGWKTIAYYAMTTTIAVTIGLVAVLTIRPGESDAGQRVRADREAELDARLAEYEQQFDTSAVAADGELKPEYVTWLYEQESEGAAQSSYAAKFARVAAARDVTPGDIFKRDIVLPLLTNPFTSLAASPPNALGLIFFSLLLGVACTFVGAPAQPVVSFFHGLNGVIMQITHWLMNVSPLAIGCIVASLVAEQGPEIFETLLWYSLTVIGGIVVHVMVLLSIAYGVAGLSPWGVWTGLREAWMIAFSTRSSAATLPVTIACTTERLKVSPKVANFALPLGATINMDGTALYEGVAVIFLIQIYGGLADVPIPEMTMMITLTIFITAVLASVGAAAVPDAGLVTMVLVATAVNLPVYYLPLIFAVDAFLDMFRTSTNVLGDVVGSLVVNRLESGRLDDAPASA